MRGWLFVAVKGIRRTAAADTGIHASHDLGEILVDHSQLGPYAAITCLQGPGWFDVEVGYGRAPTVQSLDF